MATTILQIVESESANTDRIHLYREGIFLKAYNHSAFLFQKHVKNFRPVKKFFKSIGGDAVMLGFPSANLPFVFPGGDFVSGDETHVCVPCPEINEREYALWFDAIARATEKPKKNRAAPPPPPPQTLFGSDAENRTPGGGITGAVVGELESFPIENSTPMECMMFLCRLKTELKKAKSGGL